MLCCAAVALLRSHADGRSLSVTPRLLVGRSPACGLRLIDPHASGEHALLAWTGWHWELKDLGSRNGTYVDGARLDAGVAVKLGAGSRIAFGDPERPWTLEDDEAPRLMAVHMVTGETREADGDLLVLPSEDAPEITVYPDATGGWQQEDDEGQVQAARDQQAVHTTAGSWQLQLPFVNEGTPLMQLRMSLESLSIRFAVSQDEERVEMTLLHRGVEVPLEPREHGYVLLTLARARIGDTHLSPEQRGWRDREELERMLAMDANALNVAIHRARQQLSRAGVSDAAAIVEVRRKQRRLGTDRFQIAKL